MTPQERNEAMDDLREVAEELSEAIADEVLAVEDGDEGGREEARSEQHRLIAKRDEILSRFPEIKYANQPTGGS